VSPDPKPYRWAWLWIVVLAELAFTLWIMGALRPLGDGA
jgi:hypothetical protein